MLTKLFSLTHRDPQIGKFRTKAQCPHEQKELKYIPSKLFSSFQAVGQIQDFLLKEGAFQSSLLHWYKPF